MMTFEQFQATKKEVPDLGVPTSDEMLKGVPGLTYCDVLYIETRTDRGKVRRPRAPPTA